MRGRRSLLAGVAAVATVAGGARAQEPASPQQQVDALLKEGVDYAKTQIRQTFSFLPFALVVHADGHTERFRAPTGDELDALDAPEQEADPASALRELKQRIAREAKARGDFKVIGIFSDVDVKLPDGAPSDAIQASMEQASGYCTDVFVPYQRVDEDHLTWGEPISSKAKGVVFSCK